MSRRPTIAEFRSAARWTAYLAGVALLALTAATVPVGAQQGKKTTATATTPAKTTGQPFQQFPPPKVNEPPPDLTPCCGGIAAFFGGSALIGCACIGAAILFLVIMGAVPTWIAYSRNHPDIVAISIISFIFGWTLIGWTVALVWAVKAFPEKTQGTTVVIQQGNKRKRRRDEDDD
jgi:hypothetical protein